MSTEGGSNTGKQHNLSTAWGAHIKAKNLLVEEQFMRSVQSIQRAEHGVFAYDLLLLGLWPPSIYLLLTSARHTGDDKLEFKG